MKITDVTSTVLGGAHFVRITTDTGLTGLGQSACWSYPAAVHAVIDSFREHLIGSDPLRTEHLWSLLYRMGPFRGSVLSGAVSAIDIALWDIKGQHFEVPVWQLLGGNTRDRIRLHQLLLGDFDADELSRRTSAAVADGFTAVKFDPVPGDYADLALDALVRRITERVTAARDAAGPEVDLLIELHRKFTPMQARTVIDALEPLRPLMVEDAIQVDSILSQAEIAQRVAVATAGGERLHTIWEFRELLARGSSQHVRPDLGLAGGFTHVKKIAAIAESYHSSVVTHNFLGPVLTAASVHLDASIPNFVVQEYSSIDDEVAPYYRNSLVREGGWMLLPTEPGLGVALSGVAPPGLFDLAPVAGPPSGLLARDGSVMAAV